MELKFRPMTRFVICDLLTIFRDIRIRPRLFRNVVTKLRCVTSQKSDGLNNFHSCTVHLDTINVFYSPTEAQ